MSASIAALGEDEITGDEASEFLQQLGPAVVPAMAAALQRESDDVRTRVVAILAGLESPAAVPPLLQAAGHDANPDVRGDALRALGATGDPRALPFLEAALRDPTLAVRAGGVMGCATLCTTPATIDRLADIAISDDVVTVALAARSSLAVLAARDDATATTVHAAIAGRRPDALPASTGPDQRALATLMWSDVDEASALAVLVSLLPAAAPPLQRQLLWRLGAIGDATAVPATAALLASPDPMVQAYAYDTLVRLRERGVEGADGAATGYAGRKPLGPLAAPEY